jgi:acyl-CoA thioester hydrolase
MNIETVHQKFELDITIQPGDIDQLGHVNNIVYLRWVQEAAIAHWSVLATEREKQRYLWVVAKHEIEYKRPAFTKDEVIAVTWVGKAVHRTFERHTELLRKSDRKVLAKALTLWCPIDAKTMQPTDVDEAIHARFSTQ